MKRKILHVVSAWGSGGVEKYISTFQKEISDKYIFDILAIRKVEDNALFTNNIISCGGKIFGPVDDKQSGRIFKFYKRVKMICECAGKYNYDIVHINGTIADSLLYAYVLKIKNRKMRVVVHCHGDNVDPPNVKLKTIFHKIFRRLFSNSVDYKIGCSARTVEWMFSNNNNSDVIYCGIDISKYLFSKKKRDDFRKENNISEEDFVLGTVGRICEQKNPFFLLSVLKALDEKRFNYKMLWVGEGNLFDSVKSKARELSLEEKIIFYGLSDDMQALYSSLDVFLLPSLYEGNPIVGFESQANGLRGLFSDTIVEESKISNMIEFLPISNAKLWGEKIMEIYFEKKHIRKCTLNQSEIELIDVSKCAKTIEKLYDFLIEELE